MDWGFLDIFKNANFNILMLSAAVTGWILYAFGIYEDISFAVAVFGSLYCIFAFIVALYDRMRNKYTRMKEEKRMRQQQEFVEKERNQRKKIAIYRMYRGLIGDDRKLLKLVVSQGEQDPFHYDVIHYKATNENLSLIHQATLIAHYKYGYDDIFCITTEIHPADIVVTIDPLLIEVINEYGDKQDQ